MTAPLQTPDSAEVYAKAIELLARREHAPAELVLKLAHQRGYPEEVVRDVLAQLVSENLLSSARYAEVLVRVRSAKGQGPLRIRDELAGNGIAQSLIDDTFAEARIDWFGLARKVRRKRFGARLPVDFPSKAKQMRFLQQRGFEREHIQAAFTQA